YAAGGFPTRDGAPIAFPYRIARQVANKQIDAQELESVCRGGSSVIVQDYDCGTGSIVLACARRVQSLGRRPSETMLAVAPDTDALCMQMTYLQAAVHQIPAVCLHVDAVKRRVCEQAFTSEAISAIDRMPGWPIRPGRPARVVMAEMLPATESGGGE